MVTANRREEFRAGWRAGYNQGYGEGFDSGYEAGFNEGKRLGYNEGCADAFCIAEEFVLDLRKLEKLLARGEIRIYGSAAAETLNILNKLGRLYLTPKP